MSNKSKGKKIKEDLEKVVNDEAQEASPQEDGKENESQNADNEAKEEKDPLAEANKQIEELKDKYLRTVAEFDNYKKRTLKEKSELILNGSVQTVTAILPVLDDFERALANIDKTDDVKALKEGIEIIFKNFTNILKGLGVSKIEAKGEDFNVDYHEAIAMVPGVEDDKKGKVVDCVQTGYTLNDKVIRHAKVAVGQ